MKKFIAINLCLMLIMLNIPTQIVEGSRKIFIETLTQADKDFEAEIQIKSYVFRNELNTNHESTLYTGEIVATNYTDTPSNGNQYLIIEVNLEIPNNISSYEISNLKVTDDTTIYESLDSAFLKNHYYNPIIATQLSAGFINGHLVYEVPNSLGENDLTLIYGTNSINLWELENTNKNTSIVKDTNITIVGNTSSDFQAQQNEVDTRIQKALDSGEYTFESPYIVQNPYGRSPLTALVCFVTEEETQITVNIKPKSEYGNVEYTIPTTSKTHLVPITGLYANYNNTITLTISNGQTKTIEIQTGELPFNSAVYEVDILDIEKEEEHFTLIGHHSTGYASIIDMEGETRWTYISKAEFDIEFLENGHFIIAQRNNSPESNLDSNMTTTFFEVDILGKIYSIYDVDDHMHHCLLYMGENRLAYTSKISNKSGMEDAITIIDLNTGDVLENIDFNLILDRYRPTYTYVLTEDWFHINSIDYDNERDSFIASGRHQGVFKIDENRELEWILASHNNWSNEFQPYLLTPVDEYGNELYDMTNEDEYWEANIKFFPWHNHGIEFCEDLDGNPNTEEIAVFDNRDFHGEIRNDNLYSQGIIYSIDKDNMTVRILQKFGEELGIDFSSGSLSDTNVLKNGNLLITSGAIDTKDLSTHIIEVNEKNEILWSITGNKQVWIAEEIPIYPNEFLPILNTNINNFSVTTRTVVDTIQKFDQFEKNQIDSSDGYKVTMYTKDSILVSGIATDFDFNKQLAYIKAIKTDGNSDIYGFLFQRNNEFHEIINLKDNVYSNYQIFIVDEVAEITYQYPIEQFPIENNLNFKQWIKLDNIKSVTQILDTITFDDNTNNLYLRGWAVIRDMDTDETLTVNIIFDGKKNSYSYPLEIFIRTDITTHFNDDFNYDYSGIKQTIQLSSLPVDNYSIGIEVINNDVVGYCETQYYIELTNDVIKIKNIDTNKITNDELLFHIDSFDNSTNEISLNGWCYKINEKTSNQQISAVLVGTNANYQKSLLSQTREDVGTHFNNEIYNQSGFSGIFNVSDMLVGDYKLYLNLENNGEIYYVDTGKIISKGNSSSQVNLTNLDITLQQNIITELIFSEYENSSYTIDSPYIKVDPYGIAPLSAIALFETEQEAKISIEVAGLNGGDTITHSYTDYKTSHQIPIIGLYPQTETAVTLTATYQDGSTQSSKFMLAGDSLPDDFSPMTLDKTTPNEMAYGLTFYMHQNLDRYFNAIDSNGDVRFITNVKSLGLASGLTVLENGNLLVVSEKNTGQYYKDSFFEMNLTGKIYGEYLLENVHHEVTEGNNGNFLALGNDINGEVLEDTVYEIDRNTGKIVKYWDLDDYLPIDSYNNDGKRISNEVRASISHDWLHLNAIDQHPTTNELLLSGRNHDIVFSIDYYTGEVNYILGDHSVPLNDELSAKLLTPIGDDFEWFYGQHNAQFLENGDILIFDNGSFRSKTFEEQTDSVTQGYSRGVIYRVNEKDMTIEQIWQYGKELGSSNLSTYLSGIQFLGDDHFIINFGGIVFDENGDVSYVIADGAYGSSASIQYEVKNGEIIFATSYETAGIGGNTYRVERHNPYQSTTQPDFSVKSVRLGDLKETAFIEYLTLPQASDNIVFDVISAVDEGFRIAVNLNFLNYNNDETQKYIVLENGNETRIYSTKNTTMLYINKTGLTDGIYSIGAMIIDINNDSFYTLSNQTFTIGDASQQQSIVIIDNVTINDNTITTLQEQVTSPQNKDIAIDIFIIFILCFAIYGSSKLKK